MNKSNPNIESNSPSNSSSTDWQDRLTDQMLRETVGAETPPDQSQQILAAADAALSTPLNDRSDAMANMTSRSGWARWAIAATVLVATGGVAYSLLPQGSLPTDTSQLAKAEKYSWHQPRQEESQLMVTPQIIIDEEEPTVLGVEVQSTDDLFAAVPEKAEKLIPAVGETEFESIPNGSAEFSTLSSLSSSTSSLDASGRSKAKKQAMRGGAIGGGAYGGRQVGRGVSQTRAVGKPASRRVTDQSLPSPYYLSDDVQYYAVPETAAIVPQLAESAPASESEPAAGTTIALEGREVELGESVRTVNESIVDSEIANGRGRFAEAPLSELKEGQSRNTAAPIKALAPLSKSESKQNASKPNGFAMEMDFGLAGKAPQTVDGRDTLALNTAPGHVDSFGRYRGFDSGSQRQLGRRHTWGYHNENFKRWPSDANGKGPRRGGDQYAAIHENPFIEAKGGQAVSTFSIDVDTASYSNVRKFLDAGQLPPPDSVRIEELINYFDYQYAGPGSESAPSPSPSPQGGGELPPFASHVEVAGCPWEPEHRLVRIGVKGREMEAEKRPLSNLVFLIDVSGSMQDRDKLPLVIEGLKSLTRQLGENDRVAIAVYASSEGLALPSMTGSDRDTILKTLDNLRAGGSTAGGAGIRLAYKVAEENFIKGGTNRVILCTDGDFNVGTTSTAELERMVASKAKESGVFLSVCGFGRGNLNDAMMETISGKGNGNYYYIDKQKEAEKVFVKGLTGTLVTIAKDVKIQVEFNPAQVAGYRLLGYENRMLRTQDFNDDKKDAGEIGAGHTVTAMYEIVPAGKPVGAPPIDKLKYQDNGETTDRGDATARNDAEGKESDVSDELLTLKMRYKQPEADTSTKLEWAVKDSGTQFGDASDDLRFAASVASFGMQLRGSKHAGTATLGAVLETADAAKGQDKHGYRAEFVELVRKVQRMQGD